jgi:uridylate kinase
MGDDLMRVVIRIGGSVVASPPNPAMMEKYCCLSRLIKQKGHDLVLVVGGGSLAREFIEIAKKMGLEEKEQDKIAISVSRLYAQLLNLGLSDLGSANVSKSLREAADLMHKGRIAIMGGLKPGMTTDAVAAMVAKKICANLMVKATDQDGIYTRDPRKYPDAKKIETLSFEDLSRFLEESRHRAGIHQILDPKAVQILRKEKIKTIVVNGFIPENLIAAIEGKKVGTLIE